LIFSKRFLPARILISEDSMLGQLNPCGGGDPIPLTKESLLIGRRSRCDITLEYANVSSHHCQLELVNGYWRVRDLGSRNGVKVNGERCETKWLMPGDILRVARHEFEVLYTPDASTSPPEEPNPFDIGLLEKAGLAQPSTREQPPAMPKAVKKPQQESNPESDDDFAAQWLLDDE
jgi:pSer/pThr/pTyr-binding forkhead associated (FHA) protein